MNIRESGFEPSVPMASAATASGTAKTAKTLKPKPADTPKDPVDTYKSGTAAASETTGTAKTLKLKSADTPKDPVDTYKSEQQGAELPDFKALLRLMKTKDFVFPSDAQSLKKMSDLSGQPLTQKELTEAKKELSSFIKSSYSSPLKGFSSSSSSSATAAKQWANLAESSVSDSLEGIRRVSRDIAWEKVAGKETPSTYESYFKSTQIPVDEMKQILSVRDDLQSKNSKMKLKGNDITPLMKNEIWDTKMSLLDEAIKNPIKDGKPVEISAEYYELSSDEMIGKLTDSANAGAKVRVVIDPGTLQYASKDTYDATSMAVKSASVEKLLRNQDESDIGVTLFPIKERLGSSSEIMHRKLFRVGETSVFGGMNANTGSNENVDFGMEINGPASKRIGEMFKEDAKNSAGKSVQQIYGIQVDNIRSKDKTILLSNWGFESMLSSRLAENLTGKETKEEKVSAMLENAEKQGLDITTLADFSAITKGRKPTHETIKQYLMSQKTTVTLTPEGKEFLASTVEQTVDKINGKKNLKALKDITPPEGKLPEGVKGKDVIAVGSEGFERQALLLESISTADKFIKISAFVMNKDIAKLLVEKKSEMEAQGKPFDVQVVIDPGLYSYGGTPNEEGYKILESAGIDVKLNLLERTNSHDRKNHSKLIFTDKMLMTGSTNFSSKGLRDNWEANDIVYFNEDEPSSMEKQKAMVDNYDKMFANEAIAIDSISAAQKRYENYEGADKELLVEKYRNKVLRDACRFIENYEIQSASYLNANSPADPSGPQLEGYDLLNAFSPEDIQKMRKELSTYKELEKMMPKPK